MTPGKLAPRHRRNIPLEMKTLTNKIVIARKPHTLACGCVISPGRPYHSLALLVNGSFVYRKGHMHGCTEVL